MYIYVCRLYIYIYIYLYLYIYIYIECTRSTGNSDQAEYRRCYLIMASHSQRQQWKKTRINKCDWVDGVDIYIYIFKYSGTDILYIYIYQIFRYHVIYIYVHAIYLVECVCIYIYCFHHKHAFCDSKLQGIYIDLKF